MDGVPMRFGRLTRRIRSRSAPPRSNRKSRRFVEQHYIIDKENMALLPGVPVHQNDMARDMHDFFNLIILVPIIVLNILNWNWEKLMKFHPSDGFPVHAWHGDLFHPFFLSTALYFLIDLLWVLIVPRCVKSPTTIVQHHIATLLYITIPYYFPHIRWAMGVCMMVEINTWFLIARRVFNRQGFPPWTIGLPGRLFSVRLKLISICFYISWIFIRIIVYPIIMLEYVTMYRAEVAMWGRLNVMGICLVIHAVFCVLNAKWTIDLFHSKVRQWRAGVGTKVESGL